MWESFADHKWKWIRYRSTLSSLYTIRDEFNYKRSGETELPLEDLNNLFGKLNRVVHEMNEAWMSQRGNALAGHKEGSS
jgi:hypothetical protein